MNTIQRIKQLITAEMSQAALRTWNVVAVDHGSEECPSGAEAAEMVLDADYMVVYGGPNGKASAKAFDALCQEYELDDVYQALAEVIYL